VITGLLRRDGLPDVVDRLRRAMNQPVIINGRDMPIGASLGVSLFGTDGETFSDLVRVADGRMYINKRSRKNEEAAQA